MNGILLAIMLVIMGPDGSFKINSNIISTDYTSLKECSNISVAKEGRVLREVLNADASVLSFSVNLMCIDADAIRKEKLPSA